MPKTAPPSISCQHQSGQKKTLSFEDLNFFGCFEMDVASKVAVVRDSHKLFLSLTREFE
jgi:hypothetical protein